MVKTINATIHKDAIDTKVGLTVLAKDEFIEWGSLTYVGVETQCRHASSFVGFWDFVYFYVKGRVHD